MLLPCGEGVRSNGKKERGERSDSMQVLGLKDDFETPCTYLLRTFENGQEKAVKYSSFIT